MHKSSIINHIAWFYELIDHVLGLGADTHTQSIFNIWCTLWCMAEANCLVTTSWYYLKLFVPTRPDSTKKPVKQLCRQSTCGRGAHTHTHTRPVRPFRSPLRPVYLATSVLKPGKNESDFFRGKSNHRSESCLTDNCDIFDSLVLKPWIN